MRLPDDRQRRVRRAVCTVLAVGWIAAATAPAAAQSKLRVITTLPTYAALVKELAGELAEVDAIARGDVDPHFVNPRPSFAAMLQRADMFVTTGLDLELWAPALLDRANNSKVIEGAPGHVVAYAGVKLLDVPENVSRTGGDVHVFGNPHIHTDPINAIIITRNILRTMKALDPKNAPIYDANAERFEERILRRLFGEQLVDMLGSETLFNLGRTYEFWDFVKGRTFGGKPLTDYIGGWLGAGALFRNRRIVCYHKNWAYFSARFQVPCAMYIEPKPGIPPAPGHVREVIDFIRTEKIPTLFAANYFSRTQVERVASRAGVPAVIAPEHVAGEEGIDDYFSLVDIWVTRLTEAFQRQVAQ